MTKQKTRRRSAAAVAGLTILATFGAVAYFADDAATDGSVTGGEFELFVNPTDDGSGNTIDGPLAFGGTVLYPATVSNPSNPSKAELLAKSAEADRADLNFAIVGYTGPAYATLSDFGTTDDPAAGGTQSQEMWTVFCLDGSTAVNDCTAPMNLAASATATPTFEAGVTQAFDVYVWLVDNVPAGERPEPGDTPQAQGRITSMDLDFTGITGRVFQTLPSAAPAAPAPDYADSTRYSAGTVSFAFVTDGQSDNILIEDGNVSGTMWLFDEQANGGDGGWINPAAGHTMRISIFDAFNPDAYEQNPAPIDPTDFTLGHAYGVIGADGTFSIDLGTAYIGAPLPTDRPIALGSTLRKDDDAGTGGFSYLFAPKEAFILLGEYETADSVDDAFSPVFIP